MASDLHSKASGALDSITSPIKNGLSNMEKNHQEIDEVIEKDNEKFDKIYNEAINAYSKIEPKNGNITIDEFNSFYTKDRELIIALKNMTNQLKAQKTDPIEKAKIEAAIARFDGKAIKSTTKLVSLVGSVRKNLKKQQQQLFQEIDDASAKGDLTDQQKQQFQQRATDLAQMIRDHKNNMQTRMTPTLKLLQVAFKMDLDLFDKMANETEKGAKERLQ